MGWSSGSDIFMVLIKQSMKHIDLDEGRAEFYRVMIKTFQHEDWDSESECLGIDPIFDKVIKEMHPTWFEDE